jgi:hypothetical protein
MYIVSALVILAVIGYYLFIAINTTGLSSASTTTTVVDKGFREGGTSFFSQPIGGQQITRMTRTPDAYLLKLQVAGQQLEHPVDKALYDSLAAGDEVDVTYQRKRITGGIQITSVRRKL